MINWRNPLTKSICFHLGVVLLIFISGFSWFSRTPDEKFVPITVEILNITDKNNIPKAQVAANKPKPKPEKPKPTPPKPKVEPKPEKKPEVKPEEKPEPKPEPKVSEKPAEKPVEKPKEKPVEKPVEKAKEEQKEQVDELDSLLKSLEEDEAQEQQMAQTTEEYDPTQPLSVTETNAILGLITRQIQKCWNVPAGARNAADLVVLIDVDIAEDGTLKFIGFSESANYNDEFYRVAADSARRAVLDPRCNPLRQLPPADKYGFWKELTLGFDPKQQIY